MSHLVLNVKGLKGPSSIIPGPFNREADVGVRGSGDSEVCEDSFPGLRGGGWKSNGRSGCVQHLPWFTQELQNPHSPSLQTSHFQKQSFDRERQISQKEPDKSRRRGSSVVSIRSSAVGFGCTGALLGRR